ncbi:TRAP transporter large permease [Aureimonas fodinaquatilis]|uniref:TRAP transporter large permease protein n=1 Tax=Aureimonas fodinaquatilis TaxID=2565783 RepID=A0A5B0DUN2_9HYPH|nr:TRAP transporter large permease [Aureimonas fodinaquatilis]KAA0969491.1 TRAP transporter large permease [Aureimonas fodinaquatilis]
MIWTLGAFPLFTLLLGLPVFVVLLLGVLATIGFVLPLPATMVHQNMFGAISSYTLLAVPFFLFAGELMGRGGISSRIIEWVLALVGRTPGAVGLVAVGTCGVYGSISGSSPATVASISRQIYPDMVRSGYSKQFSIGLINSGGAISVVLPPSINFLLYGAVAEQSIVRLFTAGILPGLLMLGILAIAVVVYAMRKGIREGQAFSLPHLLKTTRRAVWALLAPVIVLGSIYGGVATPTEAGGVACVYAILVTTLIHRDLTFRDVVRIAGSSALLTAQIMIIVAAAGVFSWILTISGFQSALSNYVAALDVQPWMIMLAINVLLLILGCFIDPASAILTLTPLLLPIAMQLGIDPIHFGVIMTVNLAIGMYTPPLGLNLFVTQATLNVSTLDIFRGVMPFVFLQIIALMIVTYVPALSLALI